MNSSTICLYQIFFGDTKSYEHEIFGVLNRLKRMLAIVEVRTILICFEIVGKSYFEHISFVCRHASCFMSESENKKRVKPYAIANNSQSIQWNMFVYIRFAHISCYYFCNVCHSFLARFQLKHNLDSMCLCSFILQVQF